MDGELGPPPALLRLSVALVAIALAVAGLLTSIATESLPLLVTGAMLALLVDSVLVQPGQRARHFGRTVDRLETVGLGPHARALLRGGLLAIGLMAVPVGAGAPVLIACLTAIAVIVCVNVVNADLSMAIARRSESMPRWSNLAVRPPSDPVLFRGASALQSHASHLLLGGEALFLLAVLASFSFPGLVVAGAATATLTAVAILCGSVIVWRGLSPQRADAVTAEVRRALETLRPEIVVHFSTSETGDTSDLAQWLPGVGASPRQAVIIVRESWHLANLPADIPVVYCPVSREAKEYWFASVAVALYPLQSYSNRDLTKYRDARQCFLGASDATGASTPVPVARLYDEVWVTSQRAADESLAIQEGILPDRLRIVPPPGEAWAAELELAVERSAVVRAQRRAARLEWTS